MWGDSGSEVEEEVPPPPRRQKKKPPAKKEAGAAGKGKGKEDGKAGGKPAAAAGSSKKAKAAGGGGKGAAAGEEAASPLWKAFAKSRDGVDRLGIAPLKKWQAFAKDTPTSFSDWYRYQVLGNRSVPQALRIEGLPDGFPEFCHWVAAGKHQACEGVNLKAGFEPFAVDHVRRVEEEAKPPATRSSPQSPPSRGPAASGLDASRPGSAARGGKGSDLGARIGAPFSEPIGNSGAGAGGDQKVRKSNRRTRRGGTEGTGTHFADKLQGAITELEGGFDAGDDDGGFKASAAARSLGAGRRSEEKVRELMRGGDVFDEVPGEALGPAFEDSRLPSGTQAMLSHLKRARAFRRRAERQHECLEDELERCLGRLARVEGQYLSLVAETSGQEISLASCLARARPLMETASGLSGEEGEAAQAAEVYGEAIKLLEVWVDKTRSGDGEPETAETREARELLSVALCNRSAANYSLGNFYSGKRDAQRASVDCPGPRADAQLKRSQDFEQILNGSIPPSQWPAFASLP
ncbi:unnamed protein product [Scytosiphon promiscuus]